MTTPYKCSACKAIELVPGYAIDPKTGDPRPWIACRESPRILQNAESLDIIVVAKCPGCGHSEGLNKVFYGKLLHLVMSHGMRIGLAWQKYC